MIDRSRPFIFATASSPLMALTVRRCRSSPRDSILPRLVALTQEELTLHGWHSSAVSQVAPYIIGDDVRAMRLASALQGWGFDIRAIGDPHQLYTLLVQWAYLVQAEILRRGGPVPNCLLSVSTLLCWVRRSRTELLIGHGNDAR